MKRIGLISAVFFILMIGVAAFALTWHTANQSTVAWDPVTTLGNGDPIPAGTHVEYVVYLANSVTDPNKQNPVEVWRGPETMATITLNREGSYFVGVRGIRVQTDTSTDLNQSIIGWSDDPAVVANGETFGINYFYPPSAATGLRPQP